MVAAAGIGAVLSGVAGLGGIASGLFGKSSSPGPGVGGLVRRARQLGLHPLSVLGSPIAGNFAVPNRSVADPGAAAAGLGEVGRAFSNYAADKEARARQDEADARARRMDDVNAAEAVSRTNLNNTHAATLLLGPQAHTRAAERNSRRGPAVAELPMYVDLVGPNGERVRVLNPEVSESVSEFWPSVISGAAATGVIGADPVNAPAPVDQMIPRFRARPGGIRDTLFSGAP